MKNPFSLLHKALAKGSSSPTLLQEDLHSWEVVTTYGRILIYKHVWSSMYYICSLSLSKGNKLGFEAEFNTDCSSENPKIVDMYILLNTVD